LTLRSFGGVKFGEVVSCVIDGMFCWDEEGG
jgi:hypothetical protein